MSSVALIGNKLMRVTEKNIERLTELQNVISSEKIFFHLFSVQKNSMCMDII